MSIFFGLSAAFFWGLGDYLITHLTRRVGTSRALLYVQVLSLISWIVFLFARAEATPPDISTPAGRTLWLMAIATGVFHVAGLALAYRAFEIGTHVPLGEFDAPLAARRNITGFFRQTGNFYWNLKKN